jgi:NAD(P) transhydrogenase
MYGQAYRVKEDITVTDLGIRTQHVVGRDRRGAQPAVRNRVALVPGTGRFIDPHTVVVTRRGMDTAVSAERSSSPLAPAPRDRRV